MNALVIQSNNGFNQMTASYRSETLTNALSEMNTCGGYHGPTVDKRQERNAFSSSDYEQKRLAGLRAMQNPATGYRVPTGSWSGYGISVTSPAGLSINSKIPQPPSKTEDDPVKLNTSSFVDHTPTNTLQRITMMNWPDLSSLLTSIGLEKYVRLFVSHEIDLDTFPSLTEQDLTNLGVSAFGARRKMMLVITELNKRNGPFSAAPGAERRHSLTAVGGSVEKWLSDDNGNVA